MATRKNQKSAARRKTARHHNGGGKSARIAPTPKSPELTFDLIHAQSGKVEDYVNPPGTRKRLASFHEKRVKDLKYIDKEIVKAATNLMKYENIYREKSPEHNFTTSAEREKLRSKSALKQIKVLTHLYNKHNQIILKKSEGNYRGTMNAFGKWSPESASPQSSVSSSHSSSPLKSFQTLKLDALTKPLEKTTVKHADIENAIAIAKQNMEIVQKELEELKKLKSVSKK